MEEKMIYLEKRNVYEYPRNNALYHPSTQYPEYPFTAKEIAEPGNEVYDMVRSALYGLDMDKEHYDTPNWNPLSTLIKPGDTIVIKPNMVRHCASIEQYECTLTHPSVVRAIIDYCVIAKAGKIILGDAPIQGADMNTICSDCHYNELIDFYQSKGVNIQFVDFRDLVVKVEHGVIKPVIRQGEFITVSLGNQSAHEMDERTGLYEICGYVNTAINSYHYKGHHDYTISNYILEADVIINLPKPKTHRFAGITGAQKNFVGACPDKESLPHFRAGAQCVSGDETNENTLRARIIASSYRKFLKACKQQHYKRGFLYHILYSLSLRLKNKSLFFLGAWYGNDTIWRTIIDLNYIILYARSNGVLDHSSQQRKIFTLGDMIIAGEKEGPLEPSPKKLGIILASHNMSLFDSCFCKITGFESRLIPTIYYSSLNEYLLPSRLKNPILYSNDVRFNEKFLDNIEFPKDFNFEPHPYWKDYL